MDNKNSHLDTSQGDFRAPCASVVLSLVIIGIVNHLFTLPSGFLGQAINMIVFVLLTGILWVVFQNLFDRIGR
ncbi:hypothetical protein P261_01931 [Lachnospiraceae bacterium TWA4]|nr:hypothetical protein P261_01931 [Lachnospiraceae bacterium TWA4]